MEVLKTQMLNLPLNDYPQRPLAPLWQGYGAKINREMGRTLMEHSAAQQKPPQQAYDDQYGTPVTPAEPDYVGMERFGWRTSNVNAYTSNRPDGWHRMPFSAVVKPYDTFNNFEPYLEAESRLHCKY